MVLYGHTLPTIATSALARAIGPVARNAPFFASALLAVLILRALLVLAVRQLVTLLADASAVSGLVDCDLAVGVAEDECSVLCCRRIICALRMRLLAVRLHPARLALARALALVEYHLLRTVWPSAVRLATRARRQLAAVPLDSLEALALTRRPTHKVARRFIALRLVCVDWHTAKLSATLLAKAVGRARPFLVCCR